MRLVLLVALFLSGAASPLFERVAGRYLTSSFHRAPASMTPGGVLQQWEPLHHIAEVDVARNFATLRSEFPHASHWIGGYPGVPIIEDSFSRIEFSTPRGNALPTSSTRQLHEKLQRYGGAK